MIDWITGLQGSGKSYYAADKIHKEFIEKDVSDRKYKRCFTNLDGFHYDNHDFVFFLELNEFDLNLKSLYDYYKNHLNDTDKKKLVQEKAKELDLYQVFIVIDECQDLLGNERAHLVWWITWHRHLYQHIVFITQSMSLIKSKYKIAHQYHRATPSMLQNPFRRNKFFTYKQFPDARMTLSSQAQTIKILKRDSVFDLYDSGDSVDAKNMLLRFIIISGVLFLVLIIAFYLFTLSPDDKQENNHSDVSKTTANVQSNTLLRKNINQFADLEYVQLFCDHHYCSLNDIRYPRDVLVSILSQFEMKLLKTENVMGEFDRIHILVDHTYRTLLLPSEDPKNTENFATTFINGLTGSATDGGAK